MRMKTLERKAAQYGATVEEGAIIEVVAKEGHWFENTAHALVTDWDEQVNSDGTDVTRAQAIRAAHDDLVNQGPAVPCIEAECDWCERYPKAACESEGA